MKIKVTSARPQQADLANTSAEDNSLRTNKVAGGTKTLTNIQSTSLRRTSSQIFDGHSASPRCDVF